MSCQPSGPNWNNQVYPTHSASNNGGGSNGNQYICQSKKKEETDEFTLNSESESDLDSENQTKNILEEIYAFLLSILKSIFKIFGIGKQKQN